LASKGSAGTQVSASGQPSRLALKGASQKPTLHPSPNQQHFRVAAVRRHIWEKRQFIPIQSQIYWLILLLDEFGNVQ
jgi:hypothetical protein